jgi:malonyl CoA-acyl carrier protein transacylase
MRKTLKEARQSGARPTAPCRLAVVFPGEPTDRVLSAPTSWLKDPLVAEASAQAGMDLSRALSGRAVMGASTVQPTVVALEIVAWRRLRASGVTAALVTGQGCGEIAAWAASGAIDDHDAMKLAALRGAAVQLASLVHPTTRRASPGGWNTIAMAPASDALGSAASQLVRYMRDVPQVSSLDGAVLAEDEAPELGAALATPPSWRLVTDTLARHAITDVVVLAPSRMLKNLLSDVLGERVRVHALEDDADIERIAALLDGPPSKEAAAS